MTTQGDQRPEQDLDGLPGAELVLAGMREIQYADPTECALLVLIAAPRLRRLGLDVPERNDIPRPYEHELYALLERTHGKAAYSRYNSLLRRLASFSRALEHRTRAGVFALPSTSRPPEAESPNADQGSARSCCLPSRG